MKTGFASLDEVVGGFEKGKLYILGGRPGMGKTSLAIDIVRNSGGKVLYIVLEAFTPWQRERLSGYVYSIAEYCFPISLEEISRLLTLYKDEVDLVIIEHIQRLKTRKVINRLSELAHEFSLPILALSQVNRRVDALKEHRPCIDGLRGINCEQASIADEVLFLYRDSCYGDKVPSHMAEIKICGRGTIILRQEVKDGGICFYDHCIDKLIS